MTNANAVYSRRAKRLSLLVAGALFLLPSCGFGKFAGIKIIFNISSSSCGCYHPRRCCWRCLSTCHAINIIVKKKNSHINISSRGMDKMVSADSQAVTISGHNKGGE